MALIHQSSVAPYIDNTIVLNSYKDRCHTCDFITILSRNFIARQSCSMHLSCRTGRHCRINKKLPISLVSVCLCDKVAVCYMTDACCNFVAR